MKSMMIASFLMNERGSPRTPYFGSIYTGVVSNSDGPNTINNHWCFSVVDDGYPEVKPHVAIGVGVFAAFMSESMIQASARSHLRHKATSLQSELNIAIGQITDMKRALDITTKDLEKP